jgi:hypothetical protein
VELEEGDPVELEEGVPVELEEGVPVELEEGDPMEPEEGDPAEPEEEREVDRVTILEEGQEHMLKVQRSILKNQEQILSRLAALEKRDQASAFGTPVWYTQDDYDAGDFCFESVDDSYMLPPPYIPPPPVQHHLPPPHGRRPPAPRAKSCTSISKVNWSTD